MSRTTMILTPLTCMLALLLVNIPHAGAQDGNLPPGAMLLAEADNTPDLSKPLQRDTTKRNRERFGTRYLRDRERGRAVEIRSVPERDGFGQIIRQGKCYIGTN